MAKVTSIECYETDNADYPFGLKVYLTDRNYGVQYRNMKRRDDERLELVGAVEGYYQQHDPAPVSRFELETVVRRENEKLRKELRAIRKLLMEKD